MYSGTPFMHTDTYGPKKVRRNNGVAVIRGNCGVIVNVQQKSDWMSTKGNLNQFTGRSENRHKFVKTMKIYL